MQSALKSLALHVARALGLFRLARWWTGNGLRILAYHGFELDDETAFRPQLFISTADFARRLDVLASRRFPVLPLDAALDRLQAGTLPPAAVAITIDDGFYGVSAAAAGVLARYGFPATVYVTSYYAQREAPIFRLVVRYMLERTTARRLDAADRPWQPSAGVDLQNASDRTQIADAIVAFGEGRCSEVERQEICRELGMLLGVDYDRIRRTRILSLMNRSELKELRAFGIDVQLHTHRHRFPIDREIVRQEIEDNRAALGEMLDVATPFDHFCYPSGYYDRSQWPWLEDLGVKSATTCEPGLNDGTVPRLGLRRFLDHSQIRLITFEAEVSGLLELARRGRALFQHRGMPETTPR